MTTTTTTTKAKGRLRSAEGRAKRSTVGTIAAAAKELGVDERTLKTWLAKGAPGATGSYDVAAIEEWRRRTLRPAKPKETDDWETRRRAAQAQREELRLAKDRRELIEVETAKAIVSQHAAEVRAHLEQLPEFAASLVKLPAAKKKVFLSRLKTKIRELCESLERAAIELAEREK